MKVIPYMMARRRSLSGGDPAIIGVPLVNVGIGILTPTLVFGASVSAPLSNILVISLSPTVQLETSITADSTTVTVDNTTHTADKM